MATIVMGSVQRFVFTVTFSLRRYISKTGIASHYYITDAGRDLLCLYFRTLDTCWDIVFQYK